MGNLPYHIATAWAALRRRWRHAHDDGYSTETIAVIALLTVLAIAVVGIITVKVVAKANSIDLNAP